MASLPPLFCELHIQHITKLDWQTLQWQGLGEVWVKAGLTRQRCGYSYSFQLFEMCSAEHKYTQLSTSYRSVKLTTFVNKKKHRLLERCTELRKCIFKVEKNQLDQSPLSWLYNISPKGRWYSQRAVYSCVWKLHVTAGPLSAFINKIATDETKDWKALVNGINLGNYAVLDNDSYLTLQPGL